MLTYISDTLIVRENAFFTESEARLPNWKWTTYTARIWWMYRQPHSSPYYQTKQALKEWNSPESEDHFSGLLIWEEPYKTVLDTIYFPGPLSRNELHRPTRLLEIFDWIQRTLNTPEALSKLTRVSYEDWSLRNPYKEDPYSDMMLPDQGYWGTVDKISQSRLKKMRATPGSPYFERPS